MKTDELSVEMILSVLKTIRHRAMFRWQWFRHNGRMPQLHDTIEASSEVWNWFILQRIDFVVDELMKKFTVSDSFK